MQNMVTSCYNTGPNGNSRREHFCNQLTQRSVHSQKYIQSLQHKTSGTTRAGRTWGGCHLTMDLVLHSHEDTLPVIEIHCLSDKVTVPKIGSIYC